MEALRLVLVSSSSSPNEAMVTADMSPPQDDYKTHQDLLKWVASNLGIQAEVVKESSHSLLDILTLVAPSKVTLPLNEAIIDPVKTLWQTPVSLPSTAKCTEQKYFMPTKGYEFLYSHHPEGSLVVSTMTKEIVKGSQEQRLKRRTPKS